MGYGENSLLVVCLDLVEFALLLREVQSEEAQREQISCQAKYEAHGCTSSTGYFADCRSIFHGNERAKPLDRSASG